MKTSAMCLMVLAALSAPSFAAAQELSEMPDLRLRFGLAAGGSHARTLGGSGSQITADATLDLGGQINDRFALFARVSGGWFPQFHRASAYLVFEMTPIDRLSVGTGVGWDSFGDDAEADCATVPTNRYGCGHAQWNGLSFPLIVGVNLGGRVAGSARRSGARITLEGALGADPTTGEAAGHASLSVGYVTM